MVKRARGSRTGRPIMALLDLLMRKVGEIVTRTQILDHVWDYDFRGEGGIVADGRAAIFAF